MKAPIPAGFIDSDELRDRRVRRKARRLGYKIESDQGGYKLFTDFPGQG